MKLGSTIELFQHIAKEHSGIEEHNKKEDNRIESIDIKDTDKIKLIKTNEDKKRVEIEEKETSFVFSESKFFDEFLWESFQNMRQNIEVYPGNWFIVTDIAKSVMD